MATVTNRTMCAICDEERAIMKCEGCLQTFCYNHIMDHRQELSKQLDEIEVIRDTIQQSIIEQTTELGKRAFTQQIDEWERESINKIRQTAEEVRQLLLKHTAEHATRKEVELNRLTNLLQASRQKNDFVETELIQWKVELTRIQEELETLHNIKIRPDAEILVNKISINITCKCIERIETTRCGSYFIRGCYRRKTCLGHLKELLNFLYVYLSYVLYRITEED